MAKFANLADVQQAFKAKRKLGYFKQNALKEAVKQESKK